MSLGLSWPIEVQEKISIECAWVRLGPGSRIETRKTCVKIVFGE